MKKRDHADTLLNIAVLLGILIVVLTIFLLIASVFLGGYRREFRIVQGEKKELTEILPSNEERKVESKITVGSSADLEKEKKEKDEKKEKEKQKKKEALSTKDYVIPDSSERLLTKKDVKDLTAQEINYAKNEIYARHGRIFNSPELKEYFESKSWYEGIYDPGDFDSNQSVLLLSDIEKNNVEFLMKAEKEAGTGGYDLDE